MRGQKHTDETRIKAIELLSVYSVAEVARRLNLPENTVRTWAKGETKASKADAEALVELRAQKKAEFVERGWAIIESAQGLLADLIEADKARPIEDRKLRAQDITNIIGVQYDKQALANNENTLNAGIKITLGGDLDKYAD